MLLVKTNTKTNKKIEVIVCLYTFLDLNSYIMIIKLKIILWSSGTQKSLVLDTNIQLNKLA